MLKALKSGLEGNYLNIKKAIYEKFTVHIIFNGENCWILLIFLLLVCFCNSLTNPDLSQGDGV
jgi:hypothetical protein